MDKYIREYDGQSDFYTRFLPRVDLSLSIDTILSDNTDGVVNGNLLEFKLHIADLNTVLLQCLKYLSARRVKGKPVPANILVIDLNAGRIWHYLSEPYLKEIETLYNGGASKNNGNFIGGQPENILDYGKNAIDAETVVSLLKENKYTKINIDENCIVGWAEYYYRQVPNARKEDFLGDGNKGGLHKTTGEIRDPKEFADYIYPYTGGTNIRFNYLMDRLNDFLLKKNLGAFYTPTLYCQKALDLVRMAIARVPEGNDYIILDRCAGTGNLELNMTDEELSHCIVSTIEYYEYKVLLEQLGDKVRHFIPPTEDNRTFNAGLVLGADALSMEYVENTVIKQYIDNPKCSVILFENPPYAETTSIEHQKIGEGKNSSMWKKSDVVIEMKKEVSGTTSNDMGNAFIWSGFKYYLRQPTDSYIVFSPVKYWKAQHLVNKKLIEGYAFNRIHFHTSIDACIMCALWANIDDPDVAELSLTGYNIVNNVLEELPEKLKVKKIFNDYSSIYYDDRKYDSFKQECKKGILCGYNGLEKTDGKIRNRPITDNNVLGYMKAESCGFDNPNLVSSLLSCGLYNGNGFYLQKDNYLEKLPMFAASRYITYNRSWTELGRIMKSADGATAFYRDIKNGKLQNFFLKCLFFTCLEMQNHMRTFTGSDGHFYRNELCFDGTNGPTQALADIKKLNFDDDEKKLFIQWETVLDLAKKTPDYNKDLTYGIYQIFAELDTKHKDIITKETVWDNVELHSARVALKALVVSYYNKEIVPVLFDYEFLK